jgi:nitrite reductase/ring-hydroxylating ferredoxin subunit
MHRTISALIDRQSRWADPLGDRAQVLLGGVFDRRRRLKSALNGTWLGHPVHPAVTDVPVGALTVAAVLDATGRDEAADLALAVGVAGMAVSAVTGAADAADTDGRPRRLATIHATLMVTSATVYMASLLLRFGPRSARPTARVLGGLGYAALAAGAYVGGDLTYRAGNQVDRHAFEAHGGRWRLLDVTDVPAGALVKAKAGPDTIVLYRAKADGPVSAIHGVCSHAGGPLEKGALIDGCVECPWHGSRFDLASGHVRQGPAVYDQPRFEVREAPDGTLEARRL